MESQPQNPEFRINPENFHTCAAAADDDDDDNDDDDDDDASKR